MNFLLDTNACIALMEPDVNPVQSRFVRVVRKGSEVFVSSIAAFELWYGVFKSSRIIQNGQKIQKFLSGSYSLVPFDEVDARLAGEIRASLEAIGRPIGSYDLLMAAQAMNRKMTLVTANVSEFSRVKGLDWQDWSK